jgi:hypothetical protein
LFIDDVEDVGLKLLQFLPAGELHAPPRVYFCIAKRPPAIFSLRKGSNRGRRSRERRPARWRGPIARI